MSAHQRQNGTKQDQKKLYVCVPTNARIIHKLGDPHCVLGTLLFTMGEMDIKLQCHRKKLCVESNQNEQRHSEYIPGVIIYLPQVFEGSPAAT